MNYGEMTTFKNETEWKVYLQYLETKDTSKDSEGNDPDLFPCMLVHASYHRNNSGRYEWHRTFIYLPIEKLKRGKPAVTFYEGVYLQVKVSSINHNDFRAVDGPIVRVGNGEFTWRVDGDRYAYPI